MAGTMPHAVFVETDLPSGGVAAYAAELPGCAVFAATDADAVAAIPVRVAQFGEWLRAAGEDAPRFEGGSWYEVERSSAAERRASFSLDALPPTDEELERWMRWLELAREELASALDVADGPAANDAIEALATQDRGLARELGAAPPPPMDEPIDDLYLARDALTDALVAAGPNGDEVRRVVRLAIADDLRIADQLRSAA